MWENTPQEIAPLSSHLAATLCLAFVLTITKTESADGTSRRGIQRRTYAYVRCGFPSFKCRPLEQSLPLHFDRIPGPFAPHIFYNSLAKGRAGGGRESAKTAGNFVQIFESCWHSFLSLALSSFSFLFLGRRSSSLHSAEIRGS